MDDNFILNRLQNLSLESDDSVLEPPLDSDMSQLPHRVAVHYEPPVDGSRFQIAHTAPVSLKIRLQHADLTMEHASDPILHQFTTASVGTQISRFRPGPVPKNFADLPDEVVKEIVYVYMANVIWHDEDRLPDDALSLFLNLASVSRRLARIVRQCNDIWACLLRLARTWGNFNVLRHRIGNAKLQVSSRTRLQPEFVMKMIRDISVLDIQMWGSAEAWVAELNKARCDDERNRLQNLVELRINPAAPESVPVLFLHAHNLRRLYANVPVNHHGCDLTSIVLGPSFSVGRNGGHNPLIYSKILLQSRRLECLVIHMPRRPFLHRPHTMNMQNILSGIYGLASLRTLRICVGDEVNPASIRFIDPDALPLYWPNLRKLEVCLQPLIFETLGVEELKITQVPPSHRRRIIKSMPRTRSLVIDCYTGFGTLDDGASDSECFSMQELRSLTCETSLTSDFVNFIRRLSLGRTLEQINLVVDLIPQCSVLHTTRCHHSHPNRESVEADFALYQEIRSFLSTSTFLHDNDLDLLITTYYEHGQNHVPSEIVTFTLCKLGEPRSPLDRNDSLQLQNRLHVEVTAPVDPECKAHAQNKPAYSHIYAFCLAAHERIRSVRMSIEPLTAYGSYVRGCDYDTGPREPPKAPPKEHGWGSSRSWGFESDPDVFSSASRPDPDKQVWPGAAPSPDDPFNLPDEEAVRTLQQHRSGATSASTKAQCEAKHRCAN